MTEFFKALCKGNEFKIKYIQPGKPTLSSFIECFNGSNRRGIFDTYLFEALNQLRELTQNLMKDYNELRSHQALGNLSPSAYFENLKKLNEIK
jgi:putative transposase